MKRYIYTILACACVLFGFVMNAQAQIQTRDTISISYKSGDDCYYLADGGSGNRDFEVRQNPDVACLWVVIKQGNTGNQYSIQNLNTGRYIRYNAGNNSNQRYFYLDNQSGTHLFNKGFSGNSVTDVTLQGGTSTTNRRYLAISNNRNAWSAANSGTNLTLEKWELREEAGGLKGVFAPNDIDAFGLDETDANPETKTVKFSVHHTASARYYICLADATKRIDLEGGVTATTPIELSSVTFRWKNGQTTASASCANYENAAVTNRQLLQVSSSETTTDPQKKERLWDVTITPIGSSPMEMKDGDGNWMDYQDELIAKFTTADLLSTYTVSIPVTRRSYHREVLPEFEVKFDPSTIEFPRDGGTTTINVTCTHQHGYLIRHMYGNVDDNSYDEEYGPFVTVQETLNATSSFVTFAAKKVEDETASDWLTVVGGLNDGVLTLSAPANTNTQRHARLVGIFNYTNSGDASDKHVKTIVLDVMQRIKDGNVVLLPNKGHSGEAFGKNPYSGIDEQQVHTVNKTIYYTPGQGEIELRLAETAFRGYMRWYDYETGCNPASNKIEADRTSWKTAPDATPDFKEINPPTTGNANTYGNSYGLYTANNGGNVTTPNVPVIKGWADGKAHVIACDVSAHKDYRISDTTIIEPTLSYRQLFHLRPATEIAEKFKNLGEGEFLENYAYTAPSGRVVMLSTQYRYRTFTKPRSPHSSELCYYYYLNGQSGTLGQVGVTTDATAKWYRVNGSALTEVTNPTYPTFDWLQIDGGNANTQVEYQLIVPDVHGGKDLRIARFVVDFVDVDTHGPVNSIITHAEIADKYQILEFNDFSYGVAASGTAAGNSNNSVHSNKHLPWGEATYAYYYPGLPNCDRQNSGQGNIPYYGEYALLNYMKGGSWGSGEQHGGAANGYALYVDGTTEPGLVASISTDAVICSGQTLYCSMWLMNPRVSNTGNPAPARPIFRCNIQGRHTGDAEWKDVGMYYVGALENADLTWKQVVFPIKSGESYKETRVQIYNFGTEGNGNDFLFDDLCLYASPLPLAAYHATTGCTSYSNSATTNTVVVLRIDYDQLNKDLTDKFVYYHIYDVTDSTTVALKEKVKKDGENYVYQSIYYNEAGLVNEAGVLSIDTVGSIKIPKTKDGSGIIEKTSINDFIAELTPGEHETSKSGKCFIYDDTTEKWFLYLVHVIPNEDGESGEEGVHLDREKTYSLRIANAPGDLYKAECVFTTELHAAQDTYVELRNDKVGEVRITGCMDELCANNHHILVVKVENTITPTTGGVPQTISALVHADWLVGIESDDIYCNEKTIDAEKGIKSESAFKTYYGYERNEIEDAIIAMRNTSVSNTNRKVSKANELQVIPGFTQAQLDLIKDLCNKGLLKLYQTSEMFYLGSEDIARYWVYPVAEDAEVTVNGKTHTLTDCNEPKWVWVKSSYSEYAVNLSPLNKEDQTQQQRLDLPSIRLVEGTEEVVIPVQELTVSTQLNSSLSPEKDTVRFKFNKPIDYVLEYVDLSNNRIDIMDAPAALVAGEEYLMRMAFYDEEGSAYINGDPTECRVGYIYFYLTVVPKTVQWVGDVSAVWGDNENWKGVKADGTLMDVGFVPLPGSNVIIKNLDVSKPYPVVTTEDRYPMDVYHHPNACKNIYFAPGAMIHNQHLLVYEKAFVDMKIEAANWNAMAAPLKGMYTGDMFVPHDNLLSAGGKSTEYKDVTGTNGHSDYPFVVKPFEGMRTSKAPYVFWQSLYNKRVSIYHENGNQSTPELTDNAVFAQTNSLSQALPVGSGFQVLGFGPNRNDEDEIIVRLPKPDTKYNYYYSNGTQSDQVAYVEHSSKLAFEPNAAGNMTITLTNDMASKQFMFGNPTMAYIDMEKFLKANESVLAQKYYSMSNSAWSAENMFTIETNPGTGYLAPMRSVMLELKEGTAGSKSVKVTLSTAHLVGAEGSVPASAPRKRMAAATENETQLMTIYVSSEAGQARCVLAANESCKNSYDSEEDVLFISSGVESDVNSATATTPVNMYTVSEQVPMMVDVRETIERVPLSLLVHPDYRTEKMQLAFYLSMNWNKKCYLHDTKTGERYRIMDGLLLELDMPSNHEERYYIEGPDESDNNGGTVTDLPAEEQVVEGKEERVWAYSPEQGTLQVGTDDVMSAVAVYDVLGRLLTSQKLALHYPTVTLHLPTGACIVEVTLRDNSKRYTQAIVR